MKYIAEAQLNGLTGDIGERLRSQPRITVIIAPNAGTNSPWEGGINGHFFRIRRGVAVEVPMSLAKLIEANERVSVLSRENVKEYRTSRGKRLTV